MLEHHFMALLAPSQDDQSGRPSDGVEESHPTPWPGPCTSVEVSDSGSTVEPGA